MNQNLLDSAVRIATIQALAGKPISRIVWIPPETAANDPCGTFLIFEMFEMPKQDASDIPSLERR